MNDIFCVVVLTRTNLRILHLAILIVCQKKFTGNIWIYETTSKPSNAIMSKMLLFESLLHITKLLLKSYFRFTIFLYWLDCLVKFRYNLGKQISGRVFNRIFLTIWFSLLFLRRDQNTLIEIVLLAYVLYMYTMMFEWQLSAL